MPLHLALLEIINQHYSTFSGFFKSQSQQKWSSATAVGDKHRCTQLPDISLWTFSLLTSFLWHSIDKFKLCLALIVLFFFYLEFFCFFSQDRISLCGPDHPLCRPGWPQICLPLLRLKAPITTAWLYLELLNYFSLHLFVCVSFSVCTHTLELMCACGSQKTTWKRNWLSLTLCGFQGSNSGL